MPPTKKTPFPTVGNVRDLALQMQMEVPPEWEDRNGHVNVQYYLTLYELGGWRILEEIGFDDDWFKSQGFSMFDLEHHLHFRAEIRVGDRVSTYNRLLGYSEKRFHGMYFIVNDDRDLLAGVLEYITSGVDMILRRTTAFPPDLEQGIEAMHQRHEKLAWPAPLCGVMSP